MKKDSGKQMIDLLIGVILGVGISSAGFALMLYLYPQLIKRE